MIICWKCAAEMTCEKTGVGIDFGGGHVYAGDRFGCPECGTQVVNTSSNAHFDPEHKAHSEYLEIPQKS